MTPREVLALCREREIRAVDLRFMDFPGTQKHFTVPVGQLTEASFEDGFGFDGSSLRGWQAINESDLLVVPQAETAFVDPFGDSTLVLTGNIADPVTREDYAKDPRNVARKAERYMLSTGLADRALFGAAVEFFVFDSAAVRSGPRAAAYDLTRGEAGPGELALDDTAHRIPAGGGYFAMPPADSLQKFRNDAMLLLEECGVPVLAHHHETAGGGQCEIDLAASPLVATADAVLRSKYIIKNLAARYGKSATFMPKPVYGDNGSGTHLHLSLWRNDEPLFAGSGYGGLSETAMFAIGRLPGWIAHWMEMRRSPGKRICRPRQVYNGPGEREFTPLDKR
ncbi:MAG: glutamine synthetase beta-grasp domain-containing protein, partial [Planctomycetota bacterium]